MQAAGAEADTRSPGRRSRSRGSGRRLAGTVATLAALAGAAGALFLALNHPLSPVLAVLGFAAAAAGAWAAPALLIGGLVVVLPVVGLMPWTGWLVAEELDLLVLAVGAGGYARLAFDRLVRRVAPERAAHAGGATALKTLAVSLFALATLYSMWRGFEDAGGLSWSWWHGYHEPLNSLRVAKSFVLAAWLLPLARWSWRRDPEAADRALGLGFVGGALTIALVVLWERLSQTGLLNFSTDYRATALFWEMHVGGAALDGFLALTMPFALREMLVARTHPRWLLASAVVMLGAYASLVTFSRGVYVAVPAGVALMWLLLALQRRRLGDPAGAPQEAGAGAAGWLLWLAFVALAVPIFHGSGYRGMLALLGAFTLLLPMAVTWRGMPPRAWAAGLALGVVVAPVAALVSTLFDKGAYVVYALAWTAGAVLVVAGWLKPAGRAVAWLAPLSLAVFLAVVALLCMVALHWGESRGLQAALPVAGALVALALAGGAWRRVRWPAAPRWQGGVLAAMAAGAAAAGVFLGGAYMSGRFDTVETDLSGRIDHWTRALSWLDDPARQAFGQGTGRYPATHFLAFDLEQRTGDYRLREATGGAQGRWIVLTAGRHTQGWGEMFRVSQRIGPVAGPLRVTARVRAAQDLQWHVEICRKNLLYENGCRSRETTVRATGGEWRAIEVPLTGNAVTRGEWYAPQPIAFSIAVATRAAVLEIDDLRLLDAEGRDLLANGDFEHGLANWFFTSDRNHMPWHMKNMPLHVLFEQGWVGLTLWAVLLAGALWRTAAGSARDHPLAPALAGGVLGFFVVGLFDSLLDAPRVAWAFYLAVLMSLALPASASRLAAPGMRT